MPSDDKYIPSSSLVVIQCGRNGRRPAYPIVTNCFKYLDMCSATSTK